LGVSFINVGNETLDYASFLAGMRLSPALRIAVLIAAICLCVQGQNTPSRDAQIEAKGMPPRATPADYEAQAQAGTVTIAAEFKGHSVPTLQGTLSTEDYVVIETGLFGSPGSRIELSSGDFSLRINGQKTPLPSQPFGIVFKSLKDPEWEPPVPAGPKSKTSLSGSGKGEQGDANAPPAPVQIPIPVQRAMAQRVQKASLPEGDRILPQAGLIFFQYRGKTQSIHSIELIYAGPAGKAILTLQP
jgi:hypothetical protein